MNVWRCGREKPPAEYSIEGWQRVIDINLSGVFYCMIWLSSERASFVTGAYYPVDGGYLTR